MRYCMLFHLPDPIFHLGGGTWHWGYMGPLLRTTSLINRLLFLKLFITRHEVSMLTLISCDNKGTNWSLYPLHADTLRQKCEHLGYCISKAHTVHIGMGFMCLIIWSHPGVTVGKVQQHKLGAHMVSHSKRLAKKSRALLLDIDNKLYITCSRLCRYIASGPITKQ